MINIKKTKNKYENDNIIKIIDLLSNISFELNEKKIKKRR